MAETIEKTATASKADKKVGALLLPEELNLRRRPIQDRSGKSYELAALEAYNGWLMEDYQQSVRQAESRGIPAAKVPKPKSYTAEDVFSSTLIKDEVRGNRVGVITIDGKKFYLQL